MVPFEMAEPRSLNEALALLDPDTPTIRPVAGGTALMLMMKAGVFQPTRLVSLHRIEPEHARIAVTESGELRIGAMATLSQLEHDRDVGARLPALKRALRTLSNPRVRNAACVGGALAHGDPHMDLPPVLAALAAQVTIAGPKATRELPLIDLYAGYYETVLERNELITLVKVPPLDGRKIAYVKVTARSADDWPALGIAVSFALNKGAIRDPIVVVSAATEKVTRLTKAERALHEARVDDRSLRHAGDVAAEEAIVLADAHGSAGYKRELLRVHLGRAVRQAIEQTAGAHTGARMGAPRQ
jgi:carbon-monoxide dehydrogenase medium subunit